MLSPVLFKMDRKGNFDKSLEVAGKKSIRSPASVSKKIRHYMNISSSSVALPAFEEFSAGIRPRIEVSNRQLRFEVPTKETLTSSTHTPIRGPASVRILPSAWTLIELRQQKKSQGQSVGILKSHNPSDIASTEYVELEEGENYFEALFKNRRGELKAFPLSVNFTPKKHGP